MEVMKQFNVKDEVEVFCVRKPERWMKTDVGGWVGASVLEVYGSGCESEYEVETRTALEINRRRMRVRASQIRPPPPPPDQDYSETFEEGQVVDLLLYDDLWVAGKVWEVHHLHRHNNNVTAAARTNKTILYSVRWKRSGFLGIHGNLKAVFKSKLRVHRRWVDGKWVPTPTPRQSLHNNHNNQRCVINNKSGDSSSALTCHHSSQQQRFKGFGESSHPRLSIGNDVEVSVDSINWWWTGKIKDIQGGDQIEVAQNIWSWVTDSSEVVTQFYDVSQVRPLPPKTQKRDEKITFNLHQDVEVFQQPKLHSSFVEGSWVTGEVFEIYIDNDLPNYSILIPEQGIICVDESDLRLPQQWIGGYWFQPQPLSTSYVEEQPLKRRKILSVGARVEVYSFWMEGWVSATIKQLFKNQIEVCNEEKNCKLIVDASRVRPCAENNKNRIFKEYEAVEVRNEDVWSKAEIWEVHGRGENLFYTIKETKESMMYLNIMSQSLLRARRKLVEDEWIDSSFKEYFSCPFSPQIKIVNADATDDGITDKTRLITDLKSQDVQFYKVGAEVEVFTDDMGGGWRPGTIVKLLENEIEVELQVWLSYRHVDKIDDWSMIRPKPQVTDEERNQVFQLHDEVEAFDEDYRVWYVGYILEVQLVRYRPTDVMVRYYYVSHPTKGCCCVNKKEEIRVHRNRRWIQSDSRVPPQQQQTKMDERHLEVGAEVEVYTFKYKGWVKCTTSKLCQNHIELQTIFMYISIVLHVDVSRIRPPPPPLLVEIINVGDFIEVYDDVWPHAWLKGEICGILFRQGGIFYSIYSDIESKESLEEVSESKIRACQDYVNDKWVLHPSCRTSLLTANSSQEAKYVSHNEVVGKGNNVLFPTAEDAIMDVDASSAIKHKSVACTKRKDITWQHCTILKHSSKKGKEWLECNYCHKIYKGVGINRMKQHLGHQQKGDAAPCPHVPQDIKLQIQNDLKRVSPEKACTTISAEVDAIQGGGACNLENMSCSSTMAFYDEISHVDDLNNAIKTTTGTSDFTSDQAFPSNFFITTVTEKRNESKNAYSDIFRSCFLKNKEILSFCMDQMCKVVQQIQATDYESISEAMINEWDVICIDHRNMNIDNDWLMSSAKALRDCFKEKKEKEKIVKENIENEIKKTDLDVASDKIGSICKRYGDIFKNCFIVSKELRHLLEDQMCTIVQQIQATTYDNIVEAKITKWDEICSDHKYMKIDNEWLRNSVKELKNCLEEKMANETYVKEKIKNEKKQIELKWRELTNEDGNILLKEMLEMHAAERLRQQEAQHTPHDNIMIEPTFDVNSTVKAQASECHEQLEVQQTHLGSSNNETPNSMHIVPFFATREELSTLQDRKWIVSPVVDAFGQMLIFNQKNLDGCVSRHYFPTYVGTKIIAGTCIKTIIEDLKPYYASEKLGYHLIECDMLFIPICADNHWFLYVIDLKKKQFHLLDSLQRPEPTCSQHITHKITETCEVLLTMLNDGNSLSIKWEVNRPRVPSQQNMDDCGVYMLKFMECWKEVQFEEDYSEEKIREFRKQIKNDSLNFQINGVKKN